MKILRSLIFRSFALLILAQLVSASPTVQPSPVIVVDPATAPAMAGDLPNSKLTPGEVVNVPIERLCQKGYVTSSARNIPETVKRYVFMTYFHSIPKMGDYEMDHLISLELGGANTIENLWPQSYNTSPWNAHVKDRLEDHMAEMVHQCLKQSGPAAATALLKRFQHEIATDWIAAYKRYMIK